MKLKIYLPKCFVCVYFCVCVFRQATNIALPDTSYWRSHRVMFSTLWFWNPFKCSLSLSALVSNGGSDNSSSLHLCPKCKFQKVSNSLIQWCSAYCFKCYNVSSAVLSSIMKPHVSNSCLGVGAGLLCKPCPPPLISDSLFGISSLHQLDPLTDNLLPRNGAESAGMMEK